MTPDSWTPGKDVRYMIQVTSMIQVALSQVRSGVIIYSEIEIGVG